MLIVESGPYYPSLEQAFLARVEKLKQDPWAPLAIVAPSVPLRARLQQILAQRGHAYLNLHFHTFSSLAQLVVDHEGTLKKPILSDPLFFDTVVRNIQQEDRPFRAFEGMALPQGFPAAVRSTLRDLLDSGAAVDIQDAVKEGFLGKDIDVGTLRELLRLYRLYLKRLEKLPVLPRAALIKEATRLAPTSTVLASFSEILYYGFYDATGIQVDFFQSVVKHHPARLFFPYVHEHPAYRFAKRFRDTYLQPVIGEEIFHAQESSNGHKVSAIEIKNVSGLRSEAWLVATEILKLHEEKNVPFEEIAVVARSKERLEGPLTQEFIERKIPYQSTAVISLAQVPLVKNWLTVLEAQAWPEKEKWGSYAKLAKELLEPLSKESDIEKMLLEGISSLAFFDALGASVSKADFIDTLRERWSKTNIPNDGALKPVVSLLHAEAARGLSFRVIFLIGVEERVFPRIVREDPFLRDDARLALTNTLGFKISQKMTALEEEELLFHLITTAARETCVVTFQRSDDEGSVVGPSALIRPLLDKEMLVPRSQWDRIQSCPPRFYNRFETVTTLLSQDREKEALRFAAELGEDAPALLRGFNMQKHLRSYREPNAYDGLIGPLTFHSFSPSGIEVYGRCPFQFFATRVLRLEDRSVDPDNERLDPRIKGALIHKFLEIFFRTVTAEGQKASPAKLPMDVFEQLFTAQFEAQSAEALELHPLVWDAAKLAIKESLKRALEVDLATLAETGFQPVHFEAGINVKLDIPAKGVPWEGKVDRIDIKGHSARVIDYKSGALPGGSVLTSVVRGFQMQPPLYLQMVRQHLKLNDVDFAYLSILEEGERKEFTRNDAEAYEKEIMATLGTQMTHLKDGHFPIMPDDYCASCEILSICRKNDAVSAGRSAQGPAGELWELRAKKVQGKKA